MALLSGLLVAVLSIISAVHLYWALGGFWPGKDERTLTRSVIGATGMTHMPPVWLTVMVAAAILTAALILLAWNGQIYLGLPPLVIKLGMWGVTLVFLLRGIVGYLPLFRTSNSEEPFATLNQKYFSPLCILIGMGFAIMILG